MAKNFSVKTEAFESSKIKWHLLIIQKLAKSGPIYIVKCRQMASPAV